MKICGIYIIINTANKKFYIGQSSNIPRRLKQHVYCLKNNIHENVYLQSSWNKYGEKNFDIKILELCREEELDEKEIYYMNVYDSEHKKYNLIKGGRTQKRRTGTNTCLICNEKVKSNYNKYCKNHKYVCSKCKKRYGKKGRFSTICKECQLDIAKKIYNILQNGI